MTLEINHSSNLENLLNNYSIEFKKFGHYIQVDQEIALKIVELISKKLSQIYFEDSIVEISPLNVVKFKLKLNSELILVIGAPILEDILISKKVFCNLYNNRDLIHASTYNIDNLEIVI